MPTPFHLWTVTVQWLVPGGPYWQTMSGTVVAATVREALTEAAKGAHFAVSVSSITKGAEVPQ